MIATIIGISSGIITILIIALLKGIGKKEMYGLILTGIGFLYVGYVWTDLRALIINGIQALVFLFISYYGIKKNTYILAAGYFLHGSWDIVYHLFQNPNLIPPQYDWFCLSIDFTMGLYLFVINKQLNDKKQPDQANKPKII